MRSLVGTGWVSLGVVALCGSAGNVARAESIDGKVRLGFEGSLLHHQVITTKVEGNTGPTNDGEIDQKVTQVGPGSGPLGVVLGYGVSDNVLLGAQVSAFNQNVTIESLASRDILSIGLQANASYVMGEGSVRPFLGPTVAVDFADVDTSSSQQLFKFGAQVGLLGFVAPSFSIDPVIFVNYGIGSATQTFNTGFQNVEASADLSGLTVGLRIALTGWLGDEPRRHDAGPDRDLDRPSYAPPPDPGWNAPNPGYAPSPAPQQQPAYPPPAPAYQQPAPGYPPPGYQQPPGPPPPAAAPPPAGAPSQAFPAQ